ncbi:MAG: hypothetical protein Q9181_007824 [Wetmoreana brouardii]
MSKQQSRDSSLHKDRYTHPLFRHFLGLSLITLIVSLITLVFIVEIYLGTAPFKAYFIFYVLYGSAWLLDHGLKKLHTMSKQSSRDSLLYKGTQAVRNAVMLVWQRAQKKMAAGKASISSATEQGPGTSLLTRFVMEHSIIRRLLHLLKSYKAKWNLSAISRKPNDDSPCSLARPIITAITCGPYTHHAVYFVLAAIAIHFLVMTDVFIDRYIFLFYKGDSMSTKTAVKMLLWSMYTLLYGIAGAFMPWTLVWLHSHHPGLFKMLQPGNKEEVAAKEDALMLEGTSPTVATHAEDDYVTKQKVKRLLAVGAEVRC